MLFRLKNHLIWTPEDFPFARRSCTKKLETVLNRPGGLLIPPERIKFLMSDQWWRGRRRTTPLLYKLRTQQQQNQKTFFFFFSSLSLSKPSAIHLLLHLISSFFYQSNYLFYNPRQVLNSPQLEDHRSTRILKLPQLWKSTTKNLTSLDQALEFILAR